MDDRPSSLPDRAALGSRSALRALDGEVLPPKSRLKHAEAEAPPRASAPYKVRLSTAIAGLCALLVLGGAAGGAFYVFDMRAPAAKPDPTATALNRLQEDMGRLKAGVDTLHNGTEVARQEDAVRALKKSVDVLRAELDTLRTNNTSALNQLSAKLDKPDRDASPKLTDIAARLDRIEKQVSSPLATGSIAAPTRAASPAAAQQTIAVQTLDKPLPKPATLGNWIVRDVYDGIALVEGREGGVREVAPGEFLPGAGEVRSIERRGRAWIVVTSRGIIDNATW